MYLHTQVPNKYAILFCVLDTNSLEQNANTHTSFWKVAFKLSHYKKL